MGTTLTILGSTGSIGKSALEVVRALPGRFEVVGLGAGSDLETLATQVDEFKPKWVALNDEKSAAALGERCPGVEALAGPQGVEELASRSVDITLCAIVGAAGLKAVLKAIEAGNRIALANKEPLVMAGRLIMEQAKKNGVEVLPVDSEHNAIFQCLQGHCVEDVHKIHLTASGGPFYGRSKSSMAKVRPEEATAHPTWDMGAKISVDSATLMNKGLEIIEAMWLFALPLDVIHVIIHPQSIVHSLVEFTDGSILAHLGVTDMRLPIQFALTWPERVKSPMARLDLGKIKDITFSAPDFSEFPCLKYAREAAREGGTAPAVLNAANEEAVSAFQVGRLPFLGIAAVVWEVLEQSTFTQDDSLEAVLNADAEARRLAAVTIGRLGVQSA